MKITSSAFSEGASIPAKYTCDGGDAIPPLRFEDVPEEAASLALVMDDPDAPGGTWDHWVVWNIPRDTAEVREGLAPKGVFGNNSWRRKTWGGPCPPDREHRYFFRLYALDSTLDLAPGSTKAQLEKAMRGHILAEAQLMGRYNRPRR
ncbi:MAG TPA: YbhB/YbcL family Raf kinase inhibitor-like protein [Thermoanaerobaculia bacterium]|nr:YbhB/YbcL family Raf kinase inhibitor-like protein [Thermoanaerobaculia bacterium]